MPYYSTPAPEIDTAPIAPPMAMAAADATPGSQEWLDATVNHHKVPDTKPDTLTEEAMDAAEPRFDDLDNIDKDGIITVNEAATFGVSNGIPWAEIEPIFEAMDINHDNEITKAEYGEALPVSHAMFQDFRAGFRDLDLDSDGVISDKEWMSYCTGWMAPKPDQATCQSLFQAADKFNPKGEIDQHEFETAGRHCDSIDDKDCAMLLALKGAARRPVVASHAVRTAALRGSGK